ncbi:MAG: hypothetical protein ACLS59_08505 [Clostridia bacterium]
MKSKRKGNMSRFKIRLDTESDVFKFLNVITNLKGKIELVGNDGCTQCRVNARSLIGSLYAITWKELWIESENDIYNSLREFLTE